MNDPQRLAHGLLLEAECALECGRVDSAAAAAQEAAALADRLANPLLAARAQLLLGRVATLEQRPEQASDLLHKALDAAARISARELTWRVQAAIGALHGSHGRTGREVACLRECVDLFREALGEMGHPALEAAYLEDRRRARILTRLERLLPAALS